MKRLTFTPSDANTWTATTDIGDYMMMFEDHEDIYVLYFLPAKVGSMAKQVAVSIDRGYVVDQATSHYITLQGKGEMNAIR
jgi:hypothetical protein